MFKIAKKNIGFDCVIAWSLKCLLLSIAWSACIDKRQHERAEYDCHTLLVEQITGPIVQIVIQAPNLARMFFGGYWSNLPDGPLENSRWRPCFQDCRHFHHSNFKKCICLVDFSDLNVIIYILAPS